MQRIHEVRSQINILHLNTFDTRGGAALCAYRLHQGLQRRRECRSRMLVRDKFSEDPSVAAVSPETSLLRVTRRLCERRHIQREYQPYAQLLSKVEKFSDDRGPWRDGILPHLIGFDVLHLHWIADFLHYRAFFAALPRNVPLVWTLHDKHPFTGGCHYNAGCERFHTACGGCFTLGNGRENDISRAIWARKRAALARLPAPRMHIVANNYWMAKQAQASSLLGRFDLSVIPNGVDLDQFFPVSPSAVRETFGIPPGAKVITFVSEIVSNQRKGFGLLLKALEAFEPKKDLFLLIVGEGDDFPDIGIPSLKIGSIHSTAFLREAYSAAHLCVIPSLEDNQPSTVVEAMACGAPVLAFRAGGIPEMVNHGQTGLLAEPGNVQELTECIRFLLDHEPERAAMGIRARIRAETDFSRERQVSSFLQLYAELLKWPAARCEA